MYKADLELYKYLESNIITEFCVNFIITCKKTLFKTLRFMNTKNYIEPIEKEQIRNLRFPKQEILPSPGDKKDRYRALQRALWLGNMERNKVNIIFADDKGMKRVETTVWGITEKSVILKQSTIIPLERVVKVN